MFLNKDAQGEGDSYCLAQSCCWMEMWVLGPQLSQIFKQKQNSRFLTSVKPEL